MKNFITKISTKTSSFFILIFALILSLEARGQAPYIGQSAQEVKRLIEYQVQSYYNAQGYHQIRMDDNVIYKNGLISDVIICEENVPMIDLKRSCDFCIHYIMSNGQLSVIQTQYSNITIEELKQVMSINNISIGEYFFNDDNDTYCKVYLSRLGQPTKEFRSRALNPLPLNIQSQLSDLRNKKEETTNNKPFDVTDAIKYDGFVEQKDKILYTYFDGAAYRQRVNISYIKQIESPIKAILGYYSSISNSPELTESLGLGEMCSNKFLSYVAKYFDNNPDVMAQISQCRVRAFMEAYSLNRLEISKQDSIITVSYSMTYYENNSSKDNVLGIDKFRVNKDNKITVVKLSSKESLQKRGEEINSRIYDVKETDLNAYEGFKANLQTELLRTLKQDSYSHLSFDKMLNRTRFVNFVPSWSVSDNYNLNWTIVDNSREGKLVGNTWVAGSNDLRLVQRDSLNRGNDYDLSMLKSCRIGIPEIYIDGIAVTQRSISLKNIEVDFERGITFVKVKDQSIEYTNYPPSSSAMERIKNKLSGVKKGTYLIKYEFGNIMGKEYENITYEKK